MKIGGSQRAARRASLLYLAAFAVVAAGCSTSQGSGAMGAGTGSTAPQAAKVAARLAPLERDFVIDAADKGMYEIEVSRLAAQRAMHPGVRAYAQMMVSQHARAKRELVALMRARGVVPPQDLARDKASKLRRLAGLPPSAAFDHGYVRVVGVEDHTASIEQFERARRQAKDRDLQAWIDRTLAMLRSHRAAAQDLLATLAS